MAMEFRAPWELWSVLPSWPALMRAPAGDGHTVILYPGLSASDASTLALRLYLQNLGYNAVGWKQGHNFGPRAGVMPLARHQLEEAAQDSGGKVSLLGWSLGGIFARELAKELPHLVRSVITLGTPFAGTHKNTNAWRLFELTSGKNIADEAEKFDLPTAPPVPTSSVYSRTDGVVHWQASVQKSSKAQPKTENIEVYASHLGIALNPSTWWVVADRLSQAEESWQPFRRDGTLQNWVYPDPQR